MYASQLTRIDARLIIGAGALVDAIILLVALSTAAASPASALLCNVVHANSISTALVSNSSFELR
jgi:hypothetical protein